MDEKTITQITWNGRFGNRMYQYAFGCNYANRYNCTFELPSKWEGDVLFKPHDKARLIPDEQFREQIVKSFGSTNYTEEEGRRILAEYSERIGKKIDFMITGEDGYKGKTDVAYGDLNMMYLPQIFDDMDPKFVKGLFEFKDEIKEMPLYKELESKKGTYDCAHIRRGDVSNPHYNGHHSAISLDAYHKAIRENGSHAKNVIWVSDDYAIRTDSEWYKFCKEAWKFPEGQEVIPEIVFEWLPDFLIMYFSRKLFRGNSALSWWAAFLGDCEVYSPVVEDHILCKGRNFMFADFVNNNEPHFMGSKAEGFCDIKFTYNS